MRQFVVECSDPGLVVYLADGIRRAEWEGLERFRFPTDLPASMAAHRQRLMEELAMGVLRDRARYPSVGSYLPDRRGLD